jgi:predicted RNA-binding protein Jag
MNRQQFYLWMKDPASLNTASLTDLQQIALDYPYFQTARLLLLLNLRRLQDYRFDQELRRTAALAADRKRLREWLGILAELDHLPGRQALPEEQEIETAEKNQVNAHLKLLEEQIKASLEEIELKKSQLRELIDEKKAIIGEKEPKIDDLSEKDKKFPLRPLPKDAMLEEFLLQNQSETDSRVTFFSPEESARRSIEENDGILSETLARLIAAQGKKDKAIKIYQQLMLKNPQKSSYFAAQIEKLRKES